MTPGIKSSEFRLALLCAILMIANGTEYVTIPWETLEWFIGLTGVYGVGRAVVKREDVKVPPTTGEQRTP